MTKLPLQQTQPDAMRTMDKEEWVCATSSRTSLPSDKPSRITAVLCAGSSAARIACSRAPGDVPVTRVVIALVTSGRNYMLFFLPSLLGSTPSCLSLRYKCVRSSPVFSATRVMLPPSRTK